MVGDSLSVFLFLLGGALTMIVAALTVSSAWRVKLFIGLAVAFVIGAFLWWIAPSANPMFQKVKPIAIALVQSGALVMVGTVGTVAIMLRRQKSGTFDLADLEVAPGVKTDNEVLKTLEDVKLDAAIAASDGTRGAERILPRVRAALLTAKKHFELQLPPETGMADIDMQTGQRFIEHVLPFLRQGHIEEARSEADAFIRKLG